MSWRAGDGPQSQEAGSLGRPGPRSSPLPARDQAFRNEMEAIIGAQHLEEQATELLTAEQRKGLALAAEALRESAERSGEAGSGSGRRPQPSG